jgi:hypothetical protein
MDVYNSATIMSNIEKKIKDDLPLTYEEIMEILEAELLAMGNDDDNPYKPLNFHDEFESYEE